jgi:hypothetical protein
MSDRRELLSSVFSGDASADAKKILVYLNTCDPLFAVSLEKGLMIAAVSRPNTPQRIGEIVGGLGYGGIGKIAHIDAILMHPGRTAIWDYFYNLSPEDVDAEDIARKVAQAILGKLEDVLIASRHASVVVTQMCRDQKDDKLIVVDPRGYCFNRKGLAVLQNFELKTRDPEGAAKFLSEYFQYNPSDSAETALSKCSDLVMLWYEYNEMKKKDLALADLSWEIGFFQRPLLKRGDRFGIFSTEKRPFEPPKKKGGSK